MKFRAYIDGAARGDPAGEAISKVRDYAHPSREQHAGGPARQPRRGREREVQAVLRDLPSEDELSTRRERILSRIAAAADRRGRDSGEVALLAVTKGHPAELVRRAARAGFRLFGENRVVEGARKIEALAPEFPGLAWRLIGPLQTNKAKAALQWFSAIESLDRERIAARLESLLAAEDRTVPVLLEINVGGEETKSGARPEEAESLAR